jgi:TolA-binding protein
MWPAWIAAASAVACAAALVWWRATAAVTFATSAGDGRAGAWLASNPSEELPLTFSEGSRVVMAAGSRGRVEELRHAGASFLLERGHVSARVTHRSSTDWRFLAGPFEVRVTGTAFHVDWDPARERFAVGVDEGSVAVRGPTLGEGGEPQAVGSGVELVVDLPSRTTRIGPAERAAPVDQDAASPAVHDDEAGGAAASRAGPTRSAHPTSTPSWTKLEEKGDYDGAYAAALGAGLGSVLRAASADELLRLAQVARLSGHRDTERDALVTCRRRYPGTERSSVAAYELGRSSSPSEASSWFETYLGEQPNGALAREAAGRLVEARAAAGDDRGARDAAARYLSHYPGGPHAGLARRVLAGAPE